MQPWRIARSDLKRYHHFDPLISKEVAEEIGNCPDRVEKHYFFPFLEYVSRWTKFAKKGQRGKSKERLIRYAARADAYIFSAYRQKLSGLYETLLDESGLSSSVLAYRHIVDPLTGGGKSNIHHARDAFDAIRTMQDCHVIALDIRKFFDSLDHEYLKARWAELLNLKGSKALPLDHFQVFRAMTRFASVDKVEAYRRLGLFGPKGTDARGRPKEGYLKRPADIPKRLCSAVEFRNRIAGEDGSGSIIRVNSRGFGIPQGSPISDLLANLYLFEFDLLTARSIASLGGIYLRYSDDILIIAPVDTPTALNIELTVRESIRCFGDELSIQEQKSSVFQVTQNHDVQTIRLMKGDKGKSGIEYLGFRYDGCRIFIRDSTISNLNRKIRRLARREAVKTVARYVTQSDREVQALFDVERLIRRFGRVEDFASQRSEFRNWTFWTYARKSSEVFGTLGKPILRQLSDYRRRVTKVAHQELEEALLRRRTRTIGP